MANLFDQFIKKVSELPAQISAIPELFRQSINSSIPQPKLQINKGKLSQISLDKQSFSVPSAQLAPQGKTKSSVNIFDSFVKKIKQPIEAEVNKIKDINTKLGDLPGDQIVYEKNPIWGNTYKVNLSAKERAKEMRGGFTPEDLVLGFAGGADVTKVVKSPVVAETGANVVNKIIAAVREAKPVRAFQEELYSQARGEKLAKVVNIRKQGGGEAGFIKELGALKGELPKVTYESVRDKVTQEDIDTLFNMVKDTTKITDWEKINAQVGLAKIFNKGGGSVPTEGELRLLNDVFGNQFTKTLLDKRPNIQKAWDAIKDVVNIPRTIVSSIDLSAPFRQGIFLIGRPKQFIPAFKDMFKFFVSEESYQALQDTIKNKASYQAMRDHGLAITDIGETAVKEDNFLSNIVGKLPGFKHSARAYTGFLSKLRADVFDDIVTKRGLQNDPGALKSLAGYINAATGRGSLPKFLEESAPFLNAVFFSPRLIASRLQLLNPVYYMTLNPVVRKEALKDLLASTSIIGTVLGLTKLSGQAEVGVEPTSANYGKIKVGNTRYEITGGFQPYIKFMAQFISGTITSSTTGKTITLGEGYRALTRDEILARFFSGKEAPVFSFIHDLMRGTDAVGQPLDFKTFDVNKNTILQRFTPIFIQDLRDAMDEWGITEGIVKSSPSLFGIGSQTYGGTPTTLGEAEQLGNLPLYNYLKSRPEEESNAYLDGLEERDPQKYNKIVKFLEIEQAGLGQKEFNMIGSGIKDGTRVKMIVDVLNTLPTSEEKNAYLDKLDELGLTNDTVYEQLSKFKEEGKIK